MFQDGTPGSGVTILLSQPNKENYITNVNIIDETTTDSQGIMNFMMFQMAHIGWTK